MDIAELIARSAVAHYDSLGPRTRKSCNQDCLPIADRILDRIGIVELENNSGGILQVHKRSQCEGQHCSVHNPSDHPLRHMRQVWQPFDQSMSRLCEHRYLHPDPDHVEYVRSLDVAEADFGASHICDGCCDQEGGVEREPGA